MRYLAVAHFGRGRGDWVEGEYPAHWKAAVDDAIDPHRAALQEIWMRAEEGTGQQEIARALKPIIADVARDVLLRQYPDASEIFAATVPREARVPSTHIKE